MKPISKPLLYAFAYMLYTTLAYGCGVSATLMTTN